MSLMGLCILEDKYLANVPGTVPLADLHSRNARDGIPCWWWSLILKVSFLKHAAGSDKDTVLVPQPTDSPRDPLNWPLWKRDFIFIIFATNSAAIYWWAEMLAPGYGALAQEFHIVSFLAPNDSHGRVMAQSMGNLVGHLFLSVSSPL